MQVFNLAVFVALLPLAAIAANAPMRARELGVPFHGTPGEYNAITDGTPSGSSCRPTTADEKN